MQATLQRRGRAHDTKRPEVGPRDPVASSLLLERSLGDFSLETLDGPQAKVQA